MTRPGTTRPDQPSFDDLGTPLVDVRFCVVDLETTGSALSDAITEVGAVCVRGGEVLGEFQTLVNPQMAIPPLIAVLTGITNTAVAGAPPLASVLPAFCEFARDSVLVAHNARFDIGFLRRASAELGYDFLAGTARATVLDTMLLARAILLRDEVPNHRLATLARHFRASTEPNHRALADARATVDVLHGLIERVGSLGVRTLEDLVEFTRQVSPERRRRRTWADEVPEAPGVYWFVGEPRAAGGAEEVLYVGKSVNLRRRVRSYFTAAEQRRRIDEMVRVATGVRSQVCATPLHAEIVELRLIAAHAPRYNRRSKHPDRLLWIKITDEPLPRLSIVRQVRDDGATYFGPVRHREAAEQILAVTYDSFPIRQCTPRLNPARPTAACALAELGRCRAPCDGSIGRDDYAELVEAVRAAYAQSITPLLSGTAARLGRLVATQRFEDAARLRGCLETVLATARRFHRVTSLARCAQIVAAAPGRDEPGSWDIHVLRHGRLAAAAHASARDVPQAVARLAVQTAETVTVPHPPLPAATFEEAERIADWLEQPGTRLVECRDDWYWPLGAIVEPSALPGLLGLGATDPDQTAAPTGRAAAVEAGLAAGLGGADPLGQDDELAPPAGSPAPLSAARGHVS